VSWEGSCSGSAVSSSGEVDFFTGSFSEQPESFSELSDPPGSELLVLSPESVLSEENPSSGDSAEESVLPSSLVPACSVELLSEAVCSLGSELLELSSEVEESAPEDDEESLSVLLEEVGLLEVSELLEEVFSELVEVVEPDSFSASCPFSAEAVAGITRSSATTKKTIKALALFVLILVVLMSFPSFLINFAFPGWVFKSVFGLTVHSITSHFDFIDAAVK